MKKSRSDLTGHIASIVGFLYSKTWRHHTSGVNRKTQTKVLQKVKFKYYLRLRRFRTHNHLEDPWSTFLRIEHRRSNFVGHHSDLWTLGSTLLCKSTALLSLRPVHVVFLETIALCNYFHSAMYKHQKFRNRTARRRNTPLAPWAPCTHRARGLSRPPSLRSMSLHPQNRNALLQLSFGPTGHVSKRTTSSWVTLHTNGPKLSTSFEKKASKVPFLIHAYSRDGDNFQKITHLCNNFNNVL